MMEEIALDSSKHKQVQFLQSVKILGAVNDEDADIELARGDGCWYTIQQREAARAGLWNHREPSSSSLSLGDLEDNDDEDEEDSLSLGSGSHGGSNSDDRRDSLVDGSTKFAAAKTGVGSLLSSNNHGGAEDNDAEVEVKDQIMTRQLSQRRNDAARNGGPTVRNACRATTRKNVTKSARCAKLGRFSSLDVLRAKFSSFL